jgi:hypothetical protein
MNPTSDWSVDRDAAIAAANPLVGAVGRLLQNGWRLRKPVQVTTMALAIVTDQPWAPMCVWCLEREDPGRVYEVHRHTGGECACCPYVGQNVLIVRRIASQERAA